GGRCLVRIPRGDARPDGCALPRARALGMGEAEAAVARDQGAAGEAAPGGRVASDDGSSRRIAASPSARVPAQAIAPFKAQRAIGTMSSNARATGRRPRAGAREAALQRPRPRQSAMIPDAVL